MIESAAGSLMAPAEGVQFNAPPLELMPSVLSAVDRAIANLPADKDNALVIVAGREGGNAAFVKRMGDGWKVAAWVGKKWSEPVAYGAAVIRTW